MGEIVVNPRTCKLYMIVLGVNDGNTEKEITAEDIAKFSESQRKLVDNLQQQAELMRKLAEIQEQASQGIEKIQCFCNAEREWRHEIKQWAKLGWGYKPKLRPADNKPHRAKPYWHRIRSFCVRRGYH